MAFRLRCILVLLFVTNAVAASEIAVTFDDLPVVALRATIGRQQEITRELVAAVATRRIPAVGFINGDKLLVNGVSDPARVALLSVWLNAGLELGNHTFSHPDLHRMPVAEYLKDVERGDAPLRALLGSRKLRPRFFRHPYLHTGRSAADREKVETFLAARGYRVAPVTIDNSDWIFARAYDNAAADAGLRKRLADEYVRYMLSKVAYYDAQSEKLFERKIRQVLLVHANAINADVFGRLADALYARGHRFVSLERAMDDPAYASDDQYFGPAGLSWLDRWALTRGVPKGFFAAEPRTPDWVLKTAGIEEE